MGMQTRRDGEGVYVSPVSQWFVYGKTGDITTVFKWVPRRVRVVQTNLLGVFVTMFFRPIKQFKPGVADAAAIALMAQIGDVDRLAFDNARLW